MDWLRKPLKLKHLLIVLASLFLLGAGTGGVLYADHALLDTYFDFKGSAVPSVSTAGQCRLYVDSTSNALQISVNGQGFNNLPGKMNYILNGDGYVAQRISITNFNAAAGAVTQDAYAVDHWRGSCTANTMLMRPRYMTNANPVSKSLTTNVATLPLQAEGDYPVGEHITVSLAPADAIYDGAQVVASGGSRATTLTYNDVHANDAGGACAGNITEQGLNSSSYFTVASTGANKLVWYQVIETHNKPNLRGQTVLVQFKMKGVSSGNAIRAALVQLGSTGATSADYDKQLPTTLISAYGANGTDPTYSTTSSYHVITNIAGSTTNGSITSSQAQFNIGVDWTQCWFTTVVPKNYDNLMLVFWTNNTPASGDFICQSEIGLFNDSTLQQYQPRDVQQELALCQRYGYAVTGNASGTFIGLGYVASGTTSQIICNFPVTMRVRPALTFAGTIGDMTIGDSSGTTVVTTNPPTITAGWTGLDRAMVLFTSSTGTMTSGRASICAMNTSSTSADILFFNADY